MTNKYMPIQDQELCDDVELWGSDFV